MSQRYNTANQRLGRAQINLESDDIRVIGAAAGYVFDATDEFVSDIGGGNIISRSANLSSKAVDSTGVFDAANATLPAVTLGAVITQLIIYKHVGADAVNPLIGWIDSAVNMPYTGTGADQLVQWSDGSYKIMKI